jgi:hypothetical protein
MSMPDPLRVDWTTQRMVTDRARQNDSGSDRAKIIPSKGRLTVQAGVPDTMTSEVR